MKNEYELQIKNNAKSGFIKCKYYILYIGNNNLPNSSSSVLIDCLNFFDAEDEKDFFRFVEAETK